MTLCCLYDTSTKEIQPHNATAQAAVLIVNDDTSDWSTRQCSLLTGDCPMEPVLAKTTDQALAFLNDQSFKWMAIVCTICNSAEAVKVLRSLKLREGILMQIFSIVLNESLSSCVKNRLICFDLGVNMIANDVAAVKEALVKIMQQVNTSSSAAAAGAREHPADAPSSLSLSLSTKTAATNTDEMLYSCPICGMRELTETALHLHVPLYHQTHTSEYGVQCPVCLGVEGEHFHSFAVHVHNEHGPIDEREAKVPAFGAFSWVVCRRPSDAKYLLVNEPAAIAGGKPKYWLPAGRVDAGEGFVQAAVRETLEEAGVSSKVV
eukprot:CAMPEP_0197850314 /NCGR_PEP_ID=MMETSP1438-20131217/15004_1 /TAXON_ID=1461541 /ORGANISM="Pterosperma sp., Strain CCMP1384" /LENGTH=319 /DNA_ID=CAMNT_0043463423 /DNA_START=266 /DNA_END=1222 /DNA_ORIENTATION=-